VALPFSGCDFATARSGDGFATLEVSDIDSAVNCFDVVLFAPGRKIPPLRYCDAEMCNSFQLLRVFAFIRILTYIR
jgi:hypothetical protein